jgi:hypothetical protein
MWREKQLKMSVQSEDYTFLILFIMMFLTSTLWRALKLDRQPFSVVRDCLQLHFSRMERLELLCHIIIPHYTVSRHL